MTVCEIPGRPDLYGLGIRTAFYIQWSAAVLVAFLDESELPPIRHLGLLLSAASTLSIIITASSSPPFTSSSLQPTSSSPLTLPDTPPLQPADVYITLLLASGIYLPLIPPSFVRLLTLCSPYWNPFRFLRERPSPASRACSFLLLLAVSSVAVWFYTTFLPGWWGRSDADGCDQYGFLFAPISLDDRAYVVFNALLYIVIIVACVGVMLSKVGCTVRTWAKERKRRKVRTSHRALIHTLHLLSNLTVVAVLIAAIELTISFNNLRPSAIDELASAAQTIPLFISIGVVVRVLWRWITNRTGLNSDDEDDQQEWYYQTEDGYSTSRYSAQPPPTDGGPAPPPPAHTA